ncbi:hypothetical protein QZH41_017380, partial [Actinostola sp. cb2023]
MDERLLTTSYRFEVFNPNNKMMRKALVSQNTRIQASAKSLFHFTIKNRPYKLIFLTTDFLCRLAKDFERSLWLSTLDEKSEKRRQKLESVLIQEELKCTNKEILL